MTMNRKALDWRQTTPNQMHATAGDHDYTISATTAGTANYHIYRQSELRRAGAAISVAAAQSIAELYAAGV